MVSMKHDMKDLKTQFQAMYEVLQVTEDELVEYYRVGLSCSESFEEMAKNYQKTIVKLKSSSLYKTAPAFDSKPLFDFLKNLVIVFQDSRNFYRSESFPQYAANSVRVTQIIRLCKNKVSEVLEKYISESLNSYKQYQKYEKLLKEVQAEKTYEEKNQTDPIINYAISIQEKVKEKKGLLNQRQREVSLMLEECEIDLNMRISNCNKEVEQCEELFKRTLVDLVESWTRTTRFLFRTDKISELKISLLKLAGELSKRIPSKSIKYFQDSLINKTPALLCKEKIFCNINT